jgi:PAS domain-containing protein
MTWVEMFAVLDARIGRARPISSRRSSTSRERKRAEAALRASEERYRGIVESQQAAGHAGRARFPASGFVNEHCTTIIGIPAAEMIRPGFHAMDFRRLTRRGGRRGRRSESPSAAIARTR